MRRFRNYLLGVGGLVAFAFVGLFAAPRVSGAIRATFVELVLPSQPFYGVMSGFTQQSFYKLTGPDTGTLGITNITITNNDSVANSVFIFAPILASGGCGSSAPIGGSFPNLYVYVEPASTKTITYPTPLVFGNLEGHTCVAAQAYGNVDVYVNGFVN